MLKESSTILCHVIQVTSLTAYLLVSYIKKFTDILKDSFLDLIKFILTSTYFTFDNVIYKQLFGTMSLSIIIADIVLQDIKNKALHKIGTTFPFYYRYVDNIILAAPKNSVQIIITIFNSYHERI